jgi:hypothetical protein
VKLDVPIPPGAEERAHRVAMAVYGSHRPVPRRRSYWKPAIAVVVVAAAAGVLASPPGRSVISSIREAVGVKKAQRELFSLPAPGRLLVNSASGPWVVQQDGARRLLGRFDEASWSPYGRFVVATRGDEVVAMDPSGKVHWVLGVPVPRLPAWGGTHTDTRIAYLSGERLRVVAGDGTGDAAGCPGWVPMSPAWQPGSTRILAFATLTRLEVVDAGTCKPLFIRDGKATKLQWSWDGKLLLALGPAGLRVYDLRGRVVANGGRVADATFVGGTHQVAELLGTGDVMLGDRILFHSPGLRQIVSSPDGRWLLVTWPAANQWIFVRVQAPHTIRAYAQITQQFGRGTFPEVAGWIGH